MSRDVVRDAIRIGRPAPRSDLGMGSSTRWRSPRSPA